MCCWRFKKTKKKKLDSDKKIVNVQVQSSSAFSEIKGEEVKEFTATAGTHPTHRNLDSHSPEHKKRALPSTDSKNQPTTEKSKYIEIMGELHKRIKNKEVATQEELTKMSAGDRKKRLAAAQRALGFTPNTSIMDRLVKKDREKMEKTQNSHMESRMESTSSKMGDIAFGLPQTKKKAVTQDDDTQFTKIGGKKAAEAKGKDQQLGVIAPADAYFQPPGLEKQQQETDELLSEDEEDPVDESNWMFHTKEMQATQDILRIADGDLAKFAVGDIDDNTRKGIVFDPYAPLVDIEFDEEKQKLFSCTALRYGTFITTAQMAPMDKEKDAAAKKKKAEPSAVSVVNIGADISQFLLDYSSTVEALSDCDLENIQPATEEALNQTQDSAKKKASQDLLSSKRAISHKKSRKGSKEKLMVSREQKTGLPAVSVKKNSKESRNGSKEKQKKSKESKKQSQETKAESRESNQDGSNEKRRKSREAKKTCKSME